MRCAVDVKSLEVSRHEDRFGKLFLDQRRKGFHLGLIAMHEHNVLRINVSNQVDDPFGISMCREGNIDYLHIDLICLLIDDYLLSSSQQSISQGSLHTVTGNDQGISLITAPLLEDLHAGSAVKHAWRCEEDIRHVCLQQGLIEGLHLLELEQVVAK